MTHRNKAPKSKNIVDEVEHETEELTETIHELQCNIKKLRDSQAQLVQSSKMRALAEMAAGISHEVNNPLAIIQIFSEQIRDQIQDGNLDTHSIMNGLTKITASTTRIAKIITGLRSFSRDSASDIPKKVSVESLIESTLLLCAARFQNHNISLSVVGNLDQLTLDCRPPEIEQVLIHLLLNAFDALALAASKSSTFEKWIKIEVASIEDEIQISVVDNGYGIPDSIKEKIFQPFFTTKEVGQGTGLGLSISKGLIESHSGSITLDTSSENTSFNIRLPKTAKH